MISPQEQIYGKDFVSYMKSLKILVVGVGGIGCELLKVLSKFLFKEIHIVNFQKIKNLF